MNSRNLRRWCNALLRLVLVFVHSGAAQVGVSPAAKQVRGKVTDAAGRYTPSNAGKRGVGRGLNFYSTEQERAVGQELAKRFESDRQVLHDPVVDACFGRIAERLVSASDARPIVAVRVVEGDEVSAFTLPGGFIYITTSAVLAAANEAQMAAILAHEIAHVEARHATRNASRAKVIDALFSPTNLLPGPVAYILHKLRARLLFRMAAAGEREADLLGLEYDYEAGYDVREFVRLLEKAGLQDPQSCTGFAFPTCRDRVNRLKQAGKRFVAPREANISDTMEFQSVRARVMMRAPVRFLSTELAKPKTRE